MGLTLVLASCALEGVRPGVPWTATRAPRLEDDLDVASLDAAVERTRAFWARRGDQASPAAAEALVDLFEATTDPEARRAAVDRLFTVHRLRDPLLVTGYYEPEIAARAVLDDIFRFPIYARPRDLLDVDPAMFDPGCGCPRTAGRVAGTRVVPFPTRAEIDAGALAHEVVLGWTDDPIALFGLHVQGSGRMRLDDGRVVGLHFAGTNGRPFRSLSSIMIAHGLVVPADATIPGLHAKLAELPEADRLALLAENPRYTFFRIDRPGAVGSAGVELVAGRSIAVDTRLVPHGSLVYVVTPGLRRLVVAHDTGGAITGAHIDLFTGTGTAAGDVAGRMHERGELWVLTPRGPSSPHP